MFSYNTINTEESAGTS